MFSILQQGSILVSQINSGIFTHNNSSLVRIAAQLIIDSLIAIGRNRRRGRSSPMGINKESLKSLAGTFQRFLSILRNQDICIYNIQVRVCFSWIVFPIEAVGSMHEIVVYSIPSKHFVPRSRVVANMFILFCCIFKFLQIISK